jgi:hypothetical protein
VVKVDHDDRVAFVQSAKGPPQHPSVRQPGEGVDRGSAGQALDLGAQFQGVTSVVHKRGQVTF